MKIIKGIAGAPGVSIANVLKITKEEVVVTQKGKGKEAELKILKDNIAKVDKELKLLVEDVAKRVGKEESEVFEAHSLILHDPQMIQEIKENINSTTDSAAYSVQLIFDKYKVMFEGMDDEYMKQRAVDIHDVSTRLLKSILNIADDDAQSKHASVIVVAEELTPSDTVTLDTTKVKGMAVEKGGSTSHATIISRTLGIPAVVGLTGFEKFVKNGEVIILDGNKGEVILSPSTEMIAKYKKAIKDQEKEAEELKKYINVDVKTTDGIDIVVEGNVGGLEDAKIGIANGMKGVGLFRTEFSYMNNTQWPTEEELFNNYRDMVKLNPEDITTFRTLDIGGDKILPYYKFEHEDNPFLGERSIRFSLANLDIFKTQLRALIRAAHYGKVAIMFPMIATLDEFKKAKQVYIDCYNDLKKESAQIPSLDSIKVGMMIEIPAAAIITDQFAKVADFFSIGTNDLIQYSMAADRLSEKVRYLYQPKSPSILRLIHMTIQNGHKNNIVVAVCGETAANPEMIPLLLGMGLRYFSVSPSAVLRTKKLISKLSAKEEEIKAKKAMGY